MKKVPTLIPPAVLSEPPPINMRNMVSRVELFIKDAVSIVLNPEERGTVA